MAIKRFVLTEENAELTAEQIEEAKKAAKRPLQIDPDFPPFTDEQLAGFRRVSEKQREERLNNRKRTVTIRLSPDTIKKAKSLGKGYTSILAKIVESALDDPAITERLIGR